MGAMWLDRFSVGVLFVATTGLLLLVAETSFRVGYALRTAHGSTDKPHTELLTATLFTLLGLVLAFSFAMAESRFSNRRLLVVQEANAIRTTYLRAGTIEPDRATRVRGLLRQYVESFVVRPTYDNLPQLLRRTSEIETAVWAETEAYARLNPQSEVASLYEESVNRMIELRHERVGVGLNLRLPPQIIFTLIMIAALSTALLGYDAGLVGRRSFVSGGALVLAISVVIALIVDLERPTQQIFAVSRQPFVDLRDEIRP